MAIAIILSNCFPHCTTAASSLQENLSLSERFGLTVLFARPEKRLYLEIVKELAQRHGIQMEEGVLATRAEEFALRRGHRSARAAEQFIESLL